MKVLKTFSILKVNKILIQGFSRDFLKEKLNQSSNLYQLNKRIFRKMNDACEYPFHSGLEFLRNRRNIEKFIVDNTRVLKTSYCSSNLRNKYFLNLAIEDFISCQLIHQEELAQLERWVMENKLDKLKFVRQKSAYCYFGAAGAISSPELYDARMFFAKNSILTAMVDDFFDVSASIEEMKDLIRLFEKWDMNIIRSECCSEQVEILFTAIHSTVSEYGDKAITKQGRNVSGHIIEIWLKLINCMWKEAEWLREMSVPTIEEYMTIGYISIAIEAIVIPVLYLVGPKLPEEVLKHFEFHSLYKYLGTCGRLMNDFQTFERESKQGKLNAVSLRMIHGRGDVTKEAAFSEIQRLIDAEKRQLLKLVIQGKDSVVPKACKDVFWNMIKVLSFFYGEDDGFSSINKETDVAASLFKPVSITPL